MFDVRTVYGRLIRTPVLGPFARLPLRLARWFWQSPDQDAHARLNALAEAFALMQARVETLALSEARQSGSHDHLRLHLSMLSAIVTSAAAGDEHAGHRGPAVGSREAPLHS